MIKTMNFAKALKTERLELELTQAQAAQVLNDGDPDGSPCKRTVEEWEAGRRIPMLVAQEGVFARLRAYRQARSGYGGIPQRETVLTEIVVDSSQLNSRANKSRSRARGDIMRDIKEVSVLVLANIPAGWPDDRAVVTPKREVMVAKGRFPTGVFGLDVIGDSMNAAKGLFGPILAGQTVALLPPDLRQPEHGDIVAALCDGETTLKRLICDSELCTLRAESTNPIFANDIKPAHDLVIQGVVVGKL